MSRARRAGSWILGMVLIGLASGILWNGFRKSAQQLEDGGRVSLNRRDAAGAVVLLEQAVIAEPERLSAWKLLADAASRTGQADRSMEALNVVARIAPDDANSLSLQLGGRWMANNRIQPAIRTLKIAIAADPKPPRPWRLLAQIYGVIGHRRQVVVCLMELLKRKQFTASDLIVLSSVNPSLDDPQSKIQKTAADLQRFF